MFDDRLEALSQLNDTSLKEEFRQFTDIRKESEENAKEEPTDDCLPLSLPPSLPPSTA